MRMALAEAEAALAHEDVPVGAVAVKGGKVIAEAHNERELRKDPTAHAEILLLQKTADLLGSWRLRGVSVFVTLEPCAMCAGAMVAGRVRRLVYGAPDPKAGGVYSLYNIPQDARLNHRCDVAQGVLAEESTALMQAFFRGKRGRRQPFL